MITGDYGLKFNNSLSSAHTRRVVSRKRGEAKALTAFVCSSLAPELARAGMDDGMKNNPGETQVPHLGKPRDIPLL
jgi:hypothetical protein